MTENTEREYSHITVESIRSQTFKLLDRNHELKAKMLCKLLDLPYKKYSETIRRYRSDWKREYRNRQGLKCLSFHAMRYWLYALKSMSFDVALRGGWVQSRAKNKMLIFRNDLGRIEWFRTGRVNIWVRKPASRGKLLQLLAYGFSWTGVVDDVRVFELWAGSAIPKTNAKKKGGHLVYDTGERLPYAKIGVLKDSNGVVVKTGDVSHPTAIEVEFCYPDWAERLEKLMEANVKTIEGFSSLLKGASEPKTKPEGFYV